MSPTLAVLACTVALYDSFRAVFLLAFPVEQPSVEKTRVRADALAAMQSELPRRWFQLYAIFTEEPEQLNPASTLQRLPLFSSYIAGT